MNDRTPAERVAMVVLNTIYLVASLPLLAAATVAVWIWEQS